MTHSDTDKKMKIYQGYDSWHEEDKIKIICRVSDVSKTIAEPNIIPKVPKKESRKKGRRSQGGREEGRKGGRNRRKEK